MEGADEARNKAMEHLSWKLEKFPRDLLERFMSTNPNSQSDFAAGSEAESEEIELNLGLSLGGRFGVDKSATKLIRSSSVAGAIAMSRVDEAVTVPPVAYSGLIRTSSLPAESEEQWRKRKELQTLRRLQAKRRRSEKLRNLMAEKEAAACQEERKDFEGQVGMRSRDKLEKEQQQQYMTSANRFSSPPAPPSGLPTWASAAGIDPNAEGRGGVLGSGTSLQGFRQPSSQGSAESQGGSSSGTTELESKLVQGSSGCAEARSPSSNQSMNERSNQEVVGSTGTKINENACNTSGTHIQNPSKKSNSAENMRKEIGIDAMEDMPSVFTKGDGPNGRRVEGILYRYGKGEEVRIMCVCHGSFLSPAEFVKHAGGSDVAHPLRHIVVNPSSL
ncbi:ninja-family protein AFP3-like isoform X2 [Malania oleifera]|uniref:ninja-family protein AFP3-like isoform X2 n=1 Tax=Malania oleifera TaxID=397392 RepID=UPI0025ADF2BA|nr:ninja-family protein AFP3-like isoform X2 [Malania oleifera]